MVLKWIFKCLLCLFLFLPPIYGHVSTSSRATGQRPWKNPAARRRHSESRSNASSQILTRYACQIRIVASQQAD